MHVVGQRSVRWLKRGKPCLHHLHVLCTAFPGGLSLRLAFGSFFSFFYPHPSPPPFIFPLMNQCDRCLVPLAWELMAGRRGFTRGSPVPDVQLVECGVRMMGSVLNRTRRKRGGKNEGCVGRVPSLFPL